jgi:hypothetical protein
MEQNNQFNQTVNQVLQSREVLTVRRRTDILALVGPAPIPQDANAAFNFASRVFLRCDQPEISAVAFPPGAFSHDDQFKLNVEPLNQHNDGTCYAYATAFFVRLTLARIIGRYIPSYLTILAGVLEHFPDSGVMGTILDRILPSFGLDKCFTVEQNLVEMHQRPLLCSFYLTGLEWSGFSACLELGNTFGFTRKNFSLRQRNSGKDGAHAVVLLYCVRHEGRLFGRFKNSWGRTCGSDSLWIDMDILFDAKATFYDVAFTVGRTTDLEQRMTKSMGVDWLAMLDDMAQRWQQTVRYSDFRLRLIRSCQVRNYVESRRVVGGVFPFQDHHSSQRDLIVQKGLLLFAESTACTNCNSEWKLMLNFRCNHLLSSQANRCIECEVIRERLKPSAVRPARRESLVLPSF